MKSEQQRQPVRTENRMTILVDYKLFKKGGLLKTTVNLEYLKISSNIEGDCIGGVYHIKD